MAQHKVFATAVIAGGLILAAAPRLFGQVVEPPTTVIGNPPSFGQSAAEAPDQEVITIRGEAMMVWPIEDLRRRGYDLPDVPREENAFWTYLEAINAFEDPPKEVREAFDHAFSKGWPTGYDDKLKAHLLDRANQKALSLARQASGMKAFQPCYFGDPSGSVISVLLPSMSPYRHLCKLLVADGRRLEEQGAYDKALANYVAAMRIGHHVESGFTLIEGLVGIACWAVGDKAVCEMALRRDLRPEQLREVHETLTELFPLRPSAIRGVENERLFGLSIVDEVVTRPTKLPQNMAACSTVGGGVVNKGETGWDRLEARLGRLILPDRTIKRYMEGYYDQLAELARKPVYDRSWRQFDEEAAVMSIPRWTVLPRLLLPSLSRACTIGERCRMQSLATRLAVALRLYATEHKGKPPASLAELHDMIPPGDLIDPFSGSQFVYKRDGTNWMFYSFSENEADDGGKMEDNPWKFDYVVRVPPPDVEPLELVDGE
ncbi:MAG: hypothetical protein JSV19_04615 [Phycisphaerales bacterium]|nr:MAG: hypothetical protein JSV19_04615 [Phycisphaerales bacterium]